MRRVKSSPICMLIWERVRATLPERAIWLGISLQVSIVVVMSSSKREVWCKIVLVSACGHYLHLIFLGG